MVKLIRVKKEIHKKLHLIKVEGEFDTINDVIQKLVSNNKEYLISDYKQFKIEQTKQNKDESL